MTEEEIFHQALARSRPEERAAYLEQACAGNPGLRAAVEALLRANVGASGFLEHSAPALVATALEPITERPGTVIGPYKLLEHIGEGGFGVVFLAEQQEPLRRQVALKVLKPGMDSPQVVARFEAERQALALMDHPNIAKVLDAGQTGRGRPYFVMDLVKGLPITEYCDQAQLTPRERLELFAQVCQAVQHAHQKGIIHRDLKPSNVLVTLQDGTTLVKVIDFGIAKALGQQLTDKTLFTGFAQMLGTPLYMSPEQAALSNVDVDTRSDIYSLGVLLYELLTGTTPFDKERLQEAGYDEMRRIIREEEPPRPSTRISTLGQAAATISTQRKSEPKRLSQLCRGELDWIVMKCLEKDRNRRYETANGLAQDIERYLHDEPVQACPPSAVYKLRKFARRNKAKLALAGLSLFFLVLLGAGVGWIMRDRAARQTILQHEVIGALQQVENSYKGDKLAEASAALSRAEGLLTGGECSEELCRRVRQWRADLKMVVRLQTIRLERAAYKHGRFDTESADSAYAKAFRQYGLDVKALDPDDAAKRLGGSAIKSQLVAALDHWVQVRKELLQLDEPAWRPLLDVARAADHDQDRNRMRDALINRDQTALLQLTHPDRLSSLSVESALYAVDVLRWTGAEEQALESLRQLQRQHPSDFWVNYQLALHLGRKQSPPWDEVIRFYAVALALRPENVGVLFELGTAFSRAGKREEAITVYREVLRLQPDYLEAHINLHTNLIDQGKQAEAEAGFLEMLRLLHMKGVSGREDFLNECAWHLATCLDLKARDPDRAVGLAKEAVRLQPNEGNFWSTLGVAHYRAGDWKAAAVALQKSRELRQGADARDWFFRAMAHWQLGAKDEARNWYEQAVQWMEKNARQDEELRRFRRETEELLGIKKQEA
jgi:serine/threonine protein kinase/Flp pilus assembly protein TadD